MPCSPGMTKCHRRCLHRQKVQEYRDARAAAEAAREDATGLYEAEVAEYGRLITFKDWLIATAGAAS